MYRSSQSPGSETEIESTGRRAHPRAAPAWPCTRPVGGSHSDSRRYLGGGCHRSGLGTAAMMS